MSGPVKAGTNTNMFCWTEAVNSWDVFAIFRILENNAHF